MAVTFWKRVALPVWIGAGLTSLLLVMIAYLASIRRCVLFESGSLECRLNYYWFLDSPPNEIGDTIAGIFATLAFVWIVVTVFLQSHELSEQRKELGLTREELALARKAQQEQLLVMQKQAAIFDDEKLRRDQLAAAEHVDQLFESFSILMNFSAGTRLSWDFYLPRTDGATSLEHLDFTSYFDVAENFEDEIPRFLDALKVICKRITMEFSEHLVHKGSPLRGALIESLRIINKISEVKDQLSSAQLERLNRAKLPDIQMFLILITDEKKLWQEDGLTA